MNYRLGFDAVADVVFALTALDRRNRTGAQGFILGHDDKPALRQAADEAFCEMAVRLEGMVVRATLPEGPTGDYEIETGDSDRLPGATHLMIRRLLEETLALGIMRLLNLVAGDVESASRFEGRFEATLERVSGYMQGGVKLTAALPRRW